MKALNWFIRNLFGTGYRWNFARDAEATEYRRLGFYSVRTKPFFMGREFRR